ncbi:uncharacterized protein BJX67DRAFT_344414 [Aspergillus lucknowensis]|uniref:Secreted protein n=1 Tax=Aspergillus lucknowensis TaxID=176173 RepID=A0ABR4M1U7_9EURO
MEAYSLCAGSVFLLARAYSEKVLSNLIRQGNAASQHRCSKRTACPPLEVRQRSRLIILGKRIQPRGQRIQHMAIYKA